MSIGTRETSGSPAQFFSERDASAEQPFFEAEPLSLHVDPDDVDSAVLTRPAA
jgi:hypothetical protein